MANTMQQTARVHFHNARFMQDFMNQNGFVDGTPAFQSTSNADAVVTQWASCQDGFVDWSQNANVFSVDVVS